jgi:hypothetical protein
VNRPLLLEESRPQITPGNKAPASMQAPQTHSPVSYSSRSAVSPAKVPLAIVLIWLLDSTLHRQATASASTVTHIALQRSPTPHRQPNCRHTSVPSPLCPSACLCYSSLHSLLVSLVCGCIPHAKCTPAKAQRNTQNSPSAAPLHVVFDSWPARTTHSKEITKTAQSRVNPALLLRPC